MPSELHEKLIRQACKNDGWQCGPWKTGIKAYLRKEPWKSEGRDIRDALADCGCNPDAWRVGIEGPDENFCYEVMVVELLEVEVSNHLTLDKKNQYARLWWNFDGTSFFHLRVFRMDRFGRITTLISENEVHVQFKG